MMKQEFEALAGYEVTDKDYYEVIEPMYMAVEMTKQEFVKVIDKKAFALPTKTELVHSMKKIVEKMVEKLGHCNAYDEEEELNKICRTYAKRFGFDNFYYKMGYEYPRLYRGCSFPYAVVFYNDHNNYEMKVILDSKYNKLYGDKAAC